MGGVAGVGGGRAARALRLLLLFVVALAALEYLFGSILESSPLRTYLYTPGYNTTPSTIRNSDKTTPSFKKEPTSISLRNGEIKNRTKNSTINIRDRYNVTKAIINSKVNNITNYNITVNATRDSPQTTPLLISKILDSMRNSITTESGTKKNETSLPLCDITPPDLGLVFVNKTEVELEMVEKQFPEIQSGGHYAPPNCTARHKVAIIVPYRDRQQHLAIFLNHMHPFLMKQQIEYGIFIVEQEDNKDFNRAKLMNVGFVESQRLGSGGWQCFIFHDIDLLPLDTRNMYTCPRQPRHMSASIDKLNFMLPYEDIFGGVSAMTLEQFLNVNGFSNKYWGWGGEDDDMFSRLKKVNYHIARYKMSIARYAMLDHKKSVPNPKRYQLLAQTSKTFQQDGLSTLEYELVQVVQNHLYTHILVNIDERS